MAQWAKIITFIGTTDAVMNLIHSICNLFLKTMMKLTLQNAGKVL